MFVKDLKFKGGKSSVHLKFFQVISVQSFVTKFFQVEIVSFSYSSDSNWIYQFEKLYAAAFLISCLFFFLGFFSY